MSDWSSDVCSSDLDDKDGFIKDFKENHTDTEVLFTVTVVSAAKLAEAEAAPGGLYKKLKLESSVATTNMHMFALDEQISKFEAVERSDERRVGKEWISTCRFRWWRKH